jgi:predicted DCC family thiol-disulfide oxidoreductase YuxK
VRFVLEHERQHVLRFAALASKLGRDVRERHPEIAGADSMIWVDAPGTSHERVRVRSAAALRVARYMGGAWKLALAAVIVPPPLRDAIYDFVARHRHRLTRADDRCYVPPPSVRQRFLEP